MNEIIKMPREDICHALPDEFVFVTFASFEKRCLSLPSAINDKQIVKAFVLRNIAPDMVPENKDNLETIKRLFPTVDVGDIDLNDPVIVAEKMYDITREIVDLNIKEIVIDVTTFTHEALLMLIHAIFVNREKFESVIIVYNGASRYSEWLSKGCKEVRNVIGYPGIRKPSEKDHLIILTGFEKERATKLVELLEPDYISLGNGSEPVNNNHQQTMIEIKDEFTEWYNYFQGIIIEPFDFSCSDIIATIETLNSIIAKWPEHNYILVPLNTKLSTVSSSLVALNNRNIQICYPIPETYNTDYSDPGENFSLIDLIKLFDEYVGGNS